MKSLLTTMIIFLAATANAQLKADIQDCYDSVGNTREASYCADREIERTIRQLEERIRELENGQVDLPSPGKKYSTIFRCDEAFEPSLYKIVIDIQGKEIRNDLVQKYTQGNSDTRRKNCEAALKASSFELATGMTGQCSCDGNFEPNLVFQLIDEDYKTVNTNTINKFTVGNSTKREQDCQQMVADLAICQ